MAAKKLQVMTGPQEKGESVAAFGQTSNGLVHGVNAQNCWEKSDLEPLASGGIFDRKVHPPQAEAGASKTPSANPAVAGQAARETGSTNNQNRRGTRRGGAGGFTPTGREMFFGGCSRPATFQVSCPANPATSAGTVFQPLWYIIGIDLIQQVWEGGRAWRQSRKGPQGGPA